MHTVSGDAISGENLTRNLVELICQTNEKAIPSSVDAQKRNSKKAGEISSGAIATSSGKSLLTTSSGKSLLNSMINAYVRNNKPEDAYLLYVKAVEGGHDLGAVTASIIVNALTNAGTIRTTSSFTVTSF